MVAHLVRFMNDGMEEHRYVLHCVPLTVARTDSWQHCPTARFETHFLASANALFEAYRLATSFED